MIDLTEMKGITIDPERATATAEGGVTWGELNDAAAAHGLEVGSMPYPVMNTILDGGFPPGSLNYWLSSFTQGLTDELVEITVERFATVPSPMTSILFEHFRGERRLEP